MNNIQPPSPKKRGLIFYLHMCATSIVAFCNRECDRNITPPFYWFGLFGNILSEENWYQVIL